MKDYYMNDRSEVIELIPNAPQKVLELGCGADRAVEGGMEL